MNIETPGIVEWVVTVILFMPYIVLPAMFTIARCRDWQADRDYRHHARKTQRAIAFETAFGGTLYRNQQGPYSERFVWVSDDEPIPEDFLT